MRFRGTFILLILCAALGTYIYFYEVKGGEQREKAKQAENRLWDLKSDDIQEISLEYPDRRITASRNDKEWKISAPASFAADSQEIGRLATSAAELTKEEVVESHATDLAKFGLKPAHITVLFKTKDGKETQVHFGGNNPTGSSTYASVGGSDEVFLVANSVSTGFDKKLEDLRDRSILRFEQFETQSIQLQTEKGSVELVKENDKWYIQGKEKLPADSPAVNEILSALSTGKIKEFFDEDAGKYGKTGFDKPLADVKLVVGKDRALRHLVIGTEKSNLVKGETPHSGEKLYLAQDMARPELFFVDKDLVDKLLKSRSDLRDKSLSSFERWDVDAIILTNSKGQFQFAKTEGEWVLGGEKKKTKWDAVNGILDALEKPVLEFIDAPGPLSLYGLDKPTIHVVLKQGNAVKVDCVFGKEAGKGIYAQIKGESFVKIADKESYEKLDKAESDFLEAAEPAPKEPAAK